MTLDQDRTGVGMEGGLDRIPPLTQCHKQLLMGSNEPLTKIRVLKRIECVGQHVAQRVELLPVMLASLVGTSFCPS